MLKVLWQTVRTETGIGDFYISLLLIIPFILRENIFIPYNIVMISLIV